MNLYKELIEIKQPLEVTERPSQRLVHSDEGDLPTQELSYSKNNTLKHNKTKRKHWDNLHRSKDLIGIQSSTLTCLHQKVHTNAQVPFGKVSAGYVPRTQMTHILEDLTRKKEGQPLRIEWSVEF